MSDRDRRILGVVAYVAAVFVLVGARGHVLAHLMDGRYPAGALVSDGAAFAALVGVVHAVNFGLRAALERAVRREALAVGVRAAILLPLGLPFLLVTVQLHPQKIAGRETPRDRGVAYEDVTIISDGLRLAAWFIPSTREDAPDPPPVVLVAHGLNANRSNFLEPALIARRLGFAVLTFDFRGHGESDGHATTLGRLEARDVKAAYDWLAERFPGRPVHALAYSMGAAAVARAAAEHGIFDRIVLDSSYARAENVARASVLWWTGPLATPAWHLCRAWGWVWTGCDLDDLRPERDVARLAGRPLLIVHGTADRVIPASEAERLLVAAGGRAALWLVDGAAHGATVVDPSYRSKLRAFLPGSSRK